jgi:flagellar hook-length control protein FliK
MSAGDSPTPGSVTSTTNQATAEGNYPAVSGTVQRAAKFPDFKSPDASAGKLQNRGAALSPTVFAAIGQLMPQLATQSVLQAMPWQSLAGTGEAGIEDRVSVPAGTPDKFATPKFATPALADEATSATASEVDSSTGQSGPSNLLRPSQAQASDGSVPQSGPSDSSNSSHSPDSKISDLLQPPGLSQTAASTSDLPSKADVSVVGQSTPLTGLSLETATDDGAPGALITGTVLNHANLTDIDLKNIDLKNVDLKNVDPKNVGANEQGPPSSVPGTATSQYGAVGGSTLSQSLPKNAALTEPRKSSNLRELENIVTADAGRAVASTSFIADLLNTSGADSKTQPGSQSLPLRDVSHQTTSDDNRTPAPAKADGDQGAVPLSLVPPTVDLSLNPMGAAAPSNPQGPALQPAPDSSRVNAAQARAKAETAGTGGKSADASGSAKTQSRQEGSARGGDSLAADQSNLIAPAKASETSSSSLVAGSQFLSVTGDAKNGNATSSPVVTDPQANQLEHESTGVSADQTRPEIQASYPTSLINSAKLVERIGEAELRLGMRAGEFGNVDIRTSMVRNQFSAEISVERGELGRVMAAELPGLQTRLTDQRVPVANITIQNHIGEGHTGGQSAASEQQKPRDGQPVYAMNSAGQLDEDRVSPLVAAEGTGLPASRLDIHM